MAFVLTSRERRWLALCIVLVVVVRLATLGAYPLMDTTEARYAEIARKMLETGDWLVPQFDYGVPFWGKPPLSTWLSAAAMALFGVNEFAARMPSLLLVVGCGALVHALAALRGGPDQARWTLALFAATALVFVAAGAVMTDPALALGTTLVDDGLLGRGPRPRPPPARGRDRVLRRHRDGPAREGTRRGRTRVRADRRRNAVDPIVASRVAAPALGRRHGADGCRDDRVVLGGGARVSGFPHLLPRRRALEALRGARLEGRPLRLGPCPHARHDLAVLDRSGASLVDWRAGLARPRRDAATRPRARSRRRPVACVSGSLGDDADAVLHAVGQHSRDLRAARTAGVRAARGRPLAPGRRHAGRGRIAARRAAGADRRRRLACRSSPPESSLCTDRWRPSARRRPSYAPTSERAPKEHRASSTFRSDRIRPSSIRAARR